MTIPNQVLIVIFFLFNIVLTAEGAEWLGRYIGGEIPGYEILESDIFGVGIQGGPTEDKEKSIGTMREKLTNECKEKGGKALVNFRLIFSLGDVSWENERRGVTKISPGAFSGAYGDCVFVVKPKK